MHTTCYNLLYMYSFHNQPI